MCHTISQAAEYSVIHNEAFSFMKRCTPGPFTIILVATKMVPKLAQVVKRRVVGIRIPENQIALQLVKALHSGERNVTDLVKLTGFSQPNVSRHLAVLVAAGLIGRRKEGLNVLYRIIDESLADICTIVCKRVSNQSRTR